MSASGLLWWEKLYFEIRNLCSQVMIPKDALVSSEHSFGILKKQKQAFIFKQISLPKETRKTK